VGRTASLFYRDSEEAPSMLGCNLPQFEPAEHSFSTGAGLPLLQIGIAKHYLKL
jgi:hypothetical protein